MIDCYSKGNKLYDLHLQQALCFLSMLNLCEVSADFLPHFLQ